MLRSPSTPTRWRIHLARRVACADDHVVPAEEFPHEEPLQDADFPFRHPSDGIALFEPHAPQTARCRAVAGQEATFPIFQSQIQIFKEVDLYVSFSKHPGQSGQVAGAGDRHEFSGADQSFDEPCQQSATNKIDA
ncbi:MAG: hypothetical protein ABW346_08800 [Terrimicrobium sp.]